MSPVEMTAMMKILQTLASTLGGIGLPGLLAIIFLGPTCILGLFLYMSHQASMRAERSQEVFIKSNNELLEAYRKDTSHIMHKIGERHNEALRLHDDTMCRLKTTEQSNAVLHTVVVNNTSAMEQLKGMIKTVLKERS